VIELHHLTQVYSSGRGVFDLSFTIERGEVFGYLGPNGAGKTTTIRNLLGFTNPTSGYASIAGINCRSRPHRIQSMIGYLPGEIAFFEHMSGAAFLQFLKDLRRMPDSGRQEMLLDMFALDIRQKISRMSKGMRQKLAIVAACMHDPDVYILDEPTSGLDPFMQNLFLEFIGEERRRGKTVMLSSHIFEEVQRVCSRAGILREGRIAAIEDIAQLNAMKQKVYIVTLGRGQDAQKLLDSPFETRRLAEMQVQITVQEEYRELFSLLANLAVTGFSSRQQSLEDVFMKYYGSGENPQPGGGEA
jgi:ABC-2 type transport system ATP-binding protein